MNKCVTHPKYGLWLCDSKCEYKHCICSCIYVSQLHDKSCRVYVGNLAWKVQWQNLKDHMRSLGGNVIRADVFVDNQGRSRVGFCDCVLCELYLYVCAHPKVIFCCRINSECYFCVSLGLWYCGIRNT